MFRNEVQSSGEKVEEEEINKVQSIEEKVEEDIKKLNELTYIEASELNHLFNINIRDAINSVNGPAAIESIKKELKNMKEKNVFKPVRLEDVPYDQRKKIIPSKMFIKEKMNADGTHNKWKARLVAGGHRLHEDLIGETYSPTMKIVTKQLLYQIAVTEKVKIRTCDVPCAYLNAKLDTRIFMRIRSELVGYLVELWPEAADMIGNDGCIIVELLMALYGIPQAGLLWYDVIDAAIIEVGFIRSTL